MFTIVKQTSLMVFVLSMLLGCSAHSPMIVKNTTNTNMVSSKKYPSHHNKVFLTQQSLPPNVEYEIIAEINVGKIWYGKSDDVYESIAIRAKELGADAVVEIKRWKQPSGFSWAAPHGSGKAVKLKDLNFISKMQGEMK